MIWIFCLVWTGFLLPVLPAKFKFEITKKSSSSNMILKRYNAEGQGDSFQDLLKLHWQSPAQIIKVYKPLLSNPYPWRIQVASFDMKVNKTFHIMLPDSRRNVRWNSCQKDKWKGLLTTVLIVSSTTITKTLSWDWIFLAVIKSPKKFCMILGSKRNWENILYQMEQRNNEIIESVLDMKAAMADTCSKIHTLSL